MANFFADLSSKQDRTDYAHDVLVYDFVGVMAKLRWKVQPPWMISDRYDSVRMRCSFAEMADIDTRLYNFGLYQETSGDTKRISGILMSYPRVLEQHDRSDGKRTGAKCGQGSNRRREKWPHVARK